MARNDGALRSWPVYRGTRKYALIPLALLALCFWGAPSGMIEMLAASAEDVWLVCTPLLPLSVNGAGDAAPALFLAHLSRGERTEEALSKTASSVYAVLEETHRAHPQEIRLIAAQDTIADPPDRFPAQRLR